MKELNIIYKDYNDNIVYETIEAKETTKTYRATKVFPNIYVSIINKKYINKVLKENIIIYDDTLTKEEAIEKWNEFYSNKITLLEEEIKKNKRTYYLVINYFPKLKIFIALLLGLEVGFGK